MSDITIEVPHPIIVVSDEDFEVPGLVVRIETPQPSSPSASPSPILRAQDDSYLTPFMNTERPRPPRRPRSAPPGKLVFEDEFREFAVTSAVRPTAHLPVDLIPPPPPLFRPKTFWKNTKRSGVTGASYSPSSYLIRRSTFIAAGLSLDQPVADISAFGVESRVGIIYLPSDISI
ncbi:hypothetical protein BDY19DRAFT_987478 [Irpex rosettiformis]|uniref:Uncharacterized protein n=1 Tax=Irpex rosettiformis TaxID=378272 RepID=A0ACB8TR83_9APHY|nr:hypothetical protein BDY19DRAFT_987478 [Irpex rosettiformis]